MKHLYILLILFVPTAYGFSIAELMLEINPVFNKLNEDGFIDRDEITKRCQKKIPFRGTCSNFEKEVQDCLEYQIGMINSLRVAGLNCNERFKYINNLRKQKNILDTENKLGTEEVNLFLIGEKHDHFNGSKKIDFYKELLSREKGIDCIFVEMDKLSGEKVYDQCYKNKKCPANVSLRQAPGSVSIFESKDYDHFSILFEFAIKNNIRIFPVDNRKFKISNPQREYSMASNIKDKFDNNKCKKGIFSVGKNHIKNQMPNMKSTDISTSTPSSLNSNLIWGLNYSGSTTPHKEINFKTINVVSGKSDTTLSWLDFPLCKENPKLKTDHSKPRLYSNVKDKVMFNHVYDLSFRYFNEFDFTLIID